MLLCCGGACVGAVIFSLGCAGVVPDDSRLGVLYLGAVLASLAFNAAVPLFYELAVEASYPIGEGLVTMLVTVGMNIGVLIFLFLPNIPGIGTIWMNYTAAVAGAVAFCIILPLSEKRIRLAVDVDIDEGEKQKG